MKNEFILAVLSGALRGLNARTTKAQAMAAIVSGIGRCVDTSISLELSCMQDRISEAMDSSRTKAPMIAQIENEIASINDALSQTTRVNDIAAAHDQALVVSYGLDFSRHVALHPETVISREEAHEQAIAIDAAMPKAFTHSFYGNDPAQVLPAHRLIADAVIVTAQHSHGGAHTEEYNQAIEDGFVFSNWLRVGARTMLMIKPAGVVKRYVRNTLGYRMESFCLNMSRNCPTHARAVVGARECGGIHFEIRAVAGDIELRDLCDRLITLLSPKPFGGANCEMIRQLTNQSK